MPLSTHEIASRIHDEHEHIKQEMRKIRKMMNCEVSAADYPVWRMDFLWLLRDFYNDLQKHFDLEEEGGFMADVIRLAPEHCNAVEHLRKEHESMAIAVDNVIKTLKSARDYHPETIAKICREVDDVLLALTAHEATEGHLIEAAYLMDYGGGD